MPAMVFTAIVLMLTSLAVAAQQQYVRAEENQNHELVITTTAGDQIVLPKSDRKWPGDYGEQVAFEGIAISPDRTAVGWVSYYANCCTSYPIPMFVEVYVAGRRRTFDPAIAPWNWCFVDGSARIAALSTTVHGPQHEILELWEVATGVRLETFTWMDDGRKYPQAPAWVSAIRADSAQHGGTPTHICSTKR
jgi:hypothetical protein